MFATAAHTTAAASNDQVMLALIALVATAVATLAWVIRNGRVARTGAEDAAIAAKQSTSTNMAVNNVGDDPSKHKLYDMVERIDQRAADNTVKLSKLESVVEAIRDQVGDLKRDQQQFDSHGWETLPPDIGTAVGLTTTIRDLQHGHITFHQKLDDLIAELRAR